MLVYTSERVNNRNFVLRRWLLGTFAASIPLFIDLLFPKLDLINNSFWSFYIPLFSLSHLISLLQKDRINEILIDTNSKEVSIKYYDFNEGQVHKKFSFESLQVKINIAKYKWWFSEPISIYLFKGRKEFFEVHKSKDGFSFKTLNDLKQILESLTSPVKK